MKNLISHSKNFLSYRLNIINGFITDMLKVIILKFKSFRLDNSIIIFSEARGGSTWLMEIIIEITGGVVQWEPLHKDKGLVPSSFNFGWRPKIENHHNKIDFKKLLKDIFVLKKHNKWTRRFLTLLSIFKTRTVITKFVRANNLVPFIVESFSLRYKPIFLIRHPIDTCLSQIRAFGGKDYNTLKIKESALKDYLSRDKEISALEIKLITWFENNEYALTNLNTEKLHVLHYYNLVLNTEIEVEKICRNLNIKFNSSNLSDLSFKKASSTDFKNDLKSDKEEQINKNINKLSAIEKNRIQYIFDYYNFSMYTAFDAKPNL